MEVFLLYPDREWKGEQPYFDGKSMVGDLGLKTLFRMTAGEAKQGGVAQAVREEDVFLEKTMEKVMLEPLRTEREIAYRQEILRDCLENGEFIEELYQFAYETKEGMNRLGRRTAKTNSPDAGTNLVTEAYLLRLLVDRLALLKELLKKHEQHFQSEGLKRFAGRLYEDFTEETEANLNRMLGDIAFYADTEPGPADGKGDEKRFVRKAKIVLQCDISQGLKFHDLKLEEVGTNSKKLKKTFVDKFLDNFAPESTDDAALAEIKQLEYQIVRYIMSYCNGFIAGCRNFFEQLNFQAAFYLGALHISQKLSQKEIDFSFPRVGRQEDLCFTELKDIVMAVEQKTNPVGNRSEIRNKLLLIVTGANQGGKSTFLRSIGIAQLMMQCGLFVGAKQYESGIYPAFFTHFTRREDSEMNSGRLDEELGRMSRIIDKLEEHSLILLNESFATTTEPEGSAIAYDIIKALGEAGVKVLMVTHLLSFAKRMYEEAQDTVEFLSAERKEDGRRTFKMIQQEPQLTSFGLDLYEEIIGNGTFIW